MRRILFALLLLLSLLLVACGGAAPAQNTTQEEPTAETVEPTEVPVEEPAEEPTEAPTEVAAEEPTEAPMEEPMGELPDITGMGALDQADGLLFLDAGGCDYGGYFSRIEATDLNTVVFTMCKPDPAFEAKVAFEGFGIHSMDHLIATGGTAGFIYGEALGTDWLSEDRDDAAAQAAFKNGQWNKYRVVADGKHIRTWVNDVPVADLMDERSGMQRGFIGLQVHGIGRGEGPYEVRWRNILLKELNR